MPNTPDSRFPSIIVSGFETYTEREVNAAQVVGRAMAAADPAIAYVEIPVVWGKPMDVVGGMARAPAVWLALGESSSRLRVEAVAYNHRAAHLDKRGDLPGERQILRGGAAALVNPAPVGLLAGRLAEAGYPCHVSHDAGGYLCEELYYVLLHHQAQVWRDPVFVHFLHLPVFGAPLPGGAGRTVDAGYLCGLAAILRSEVANSQAGWLVV
jgi:pyroglutamyl-peptidase